MPLQQHRSCLANAASPALNSRALRSKPARCRPLFSRQARKKIGAVRPLSWQLQSRSRSPRLPGRRSVLRHSRSGRRLRRQRGGPAIAATAHRDRRAWLRLGPRDRLRSSWLGTARHRHAEKLIDTFARSPFGNSEAAGDRHMPTRGVEQQRRYPLANGFRMREGGFAARVPDQDREFLAAHAAFPA